MAERSLSVHAVTHLSFSIIQELCWEKSSRDSVNRLHNVHCQVVITNLQGYRIVR